MFGTINGRFQHLTEGKVEDMLTAFRLSCSPDYKMPIGTRLFKDGLDTPLSERAMPALGHLDGIIIGLGGADPPSRPPEQITEEWQESAETFFDPERNKLTYFQRLVVIKHVLAAQGVPLDKVHILPKFPHHFYPSRIGLFESERDRAFQYIAVENDRHLRRIHAKRPEERGITVIYQDVRKREDFALDIRPIIEEMGKTRFETKMLGDSIATDAPQVIVIPYKSATPSPYELYRALNEELKEADPLTTHIVFLPQDRREDSDYLCWCLP